MADDAGVKRGRMIVVVGPSGAGKDTLIAYAANVLLDRTDIVFVRRVITRSPDAGGEDHHGVSVDEFERMAEDGQFAVSWSAHGLRYGVPAAASNLISAGKLVVVNGSRVAMDRFHALFPDIVVVEITARRDVLASRLQARGREDRRDIAQRLKRIPPDISNKYNSVLIDNSGTISHSGAAFVELLEQQARVLHRS